MAAAPASAAAALALINNNTGKIDQVGFDLLQLVGATNDANCLFISSDKKADPGSIIFVSAATVSASAGVLAIARSMSALGLDIYRYVISTTELQQFLGPDATGVFVQYAVCPTDVEWIDALHALLYQNPHA